MKIAEVAIRNKITTLVFTAVFFHESFFIPNGIIFTILMILFYLKIPQGYPRQIIDFAYFSVMVLATFMSWRFSKSRALFFIFIMVLCERVLFYKLQSLHQATDLF